MIPHMHNNLLYKLSFCFVNELLHLDKFWESEPIH